MSKPKFQPRTPAESDNIDFTGCSPRTSLAMLIRQSFNRLGHSFEIKQSSSPRQDNTLSQENIAKASQQNTHSSHTVDATRKKGLSKDPYHTTESLSVPQKSSILRMPSWRSGNPNPVQPETQAKTSKFKTPEPPRLTQRNTNVCQSAPTSLERKATPTQGNDQHRWELAQKSQSRYLQEKSSSDSSIVSQNVPKVHSALCRVSSTASGGSRNPVVLKDVRDPNVPVQPEFTWCAAQMPDVITSVDLHMNIAEFRLRRELRIKHMPLDEDHLYELLERLRERVTMLAKDTWRLYGRKLYVHDFLYVEDGQCSLEVVLPLDTPLLRQEVYSLWRKIISSFRESAYATAILITNNKHKQNARI